MNEAAQVKYHLFTDHPLSALFPLQVHSSGRGYRAPFDLALVKPIDFFFFSVPLWMASQGR